MITQELNKEAATQLFSENAIFFYTADAVPEYRVYELFGAAAAAFYDRNRNCTGLFVGGRDYNATGNCSSERPLTTYFTKSGFMQFVTEHNYLLTVEKAAQSEGGRIAAELRKKWNDELLDAEAAAEQAKQERKAKREAKRKAEQEANA